MWRKGASSLPDYIIRALNEGKLVTLFNPQFSICCISTCTLQGNKHKHGASKKIIGGSLVAKLCLTLVTPWTVARQAPLSMGFPRKNTGVGCISFSRGSS